MTEKKYSKRNGVKRRSVSLERECSLGVISLNNLEWSDHLVKIVDYSVIGIGIESDQPIEPGVIWFKENLYGQKCGSLVWCKKNGARYRAGLQFISLTREQEEYIRQQVEQMQYFKRIQDPKQVIAKLIAGIKKDMDESLVHSQGRNIPLNDK